MIGIEMILTALAERLASPGDPPLCDAELSRRCELHEDAVRDIRRRGQCGRWIASTLVAAGLKCGACTAADADRWKLALLGVEVSHD